jgi:hypothetical protein
MAKKEKTFNEQAYLIYDRFIKNKNNKRAGSKIKISNLKDSMTVHRVVGNYTPVNFVSKLTKRSSLDMYRHFLDLETYKLTSLVPHVKLFKVHDGRNIPFYFPTAAESTSFHSMLQPGSGTGASAIRDFNVKFQGQDPFSADKQLQCSLNIYVDTLENIFKDPPAGYAPLAEVFTITRNKYIPLKEGLSKEVTTEQVNSASSHEIMAVLGYSVDKKSKIFSRKEREAIENTSLTVRMTLTNHNISLSQDGTATISVDFIGRLSGLLNDSFYNQLATEQDMLSLSRLQAEQESIEFEPDKAAEKKVVLQKRIKQATRTRFRKLFEHLDSKAESADILTAFSSSRLYEMSISNGDIQRYMNYVNGDAAVDIEEESNKKEPTADAVDSNTESPNAKEEATKIPKETLENALQYDNKRISYVYLGDFIESAIVMTKEVLESAIKEAESSRKKKNAKKTEEKLKPLRASLEGLKTTKVLLGNFSYPVGKNESITVNIADVPISMRVLQDYIFNNIEQQYATKYSLGRFMDDLILQVLPSALKQHTFSDAPNLFSDLNIKSLTITGDNKAELLSNIDMDIRELPDFLKKASKHKKKKEEVDYLVFYSEPSSKTQSGLSGDLRKDASNGVYHFNLGKDRGMLKSINFSQINQKYRREALMMESVSLYDELKMPYSASITMMGNGLFLPGSVVYVNPSSIGFGDPRNPRSSSARLGLGGYYTVTSVETTYNNGTMVTSLQAEYLSWADNDTTMMSEAITSIQRQAQRAVDRGEP